MTIKDAKTRLIVLACMCEGKDFYDKVDAEALKLAIKSLETIQRIDDVLNVEGMTEIDILDEIVDAVSEFKYDCEVDGEC